MANFVIDFKNLYNRQFGKDPVVLDDRQVQQLAEYQIAIQNETEVSPRGSSLYAKYNGKDIWLPIKFFDLDESIYGSSEVLLPFASINVLSSSKTTVKTPLAQRKGKVREEYSLNDWSITINGFILGISPTGLPIFPEKELELLRNLYEDSSTIKLDNAISNIFLRDEQNVYISDLKINPPESGKKNYCAFSLSLESDTIFTLELQ